MNLGRDFDMMMYEHGDDIAGVEHRLHLTDFSFLEAPSRRRPFLAKFRHGLRTVTQIRKIRIHIVLEMKEKPL